MAQLKTLGATLIVLAALAATPAAAQGGSTETCARQQPRGGEAREGETRTDNAGKPGAGKSARACQPESQQPTDFLFVRRVG